MQHENWAGNLRYRAARVHRPASVQEVCEIVKRAGRVKALGTRHSFNGIGDTEGDHISTAGLGRVIALDRERRTVTVEGGIRYGDLCRYLNAEGFALPSLASLPHISVAGACATATHGSGDRCANLAASVCAVDIVTAEGEVRTFSRLPGGGRAGSAVRPGAGAPGSGVGSGASGNGFDGGTPGSGFDGDPGSDFGGGDFDGADFDGAVVNLGALGVVVALTLELVPAFDMRQTVYRGLSLDRLEERFDEVFACGYSVSLFTTWRESVIEQVWVKSRLDDGDAADSLLGGLGAQPARTKLHPIPGVPAENCTDQLGKIGPWHERLPHFRMEFTPSAGDELQSEYFVPRSRAMEALRAIDGIREHVAPVLHVSEVRSIARDSMWMSPCYGRDTISIHFTWKKEWEAVRAVLPLIEKVLAPFEPRPHWGKLFHMAPERVRALFPRLPDFRRLVQECDPHGKFRNPFLEAYVLGTGGD